MTCRSGSCDAYEGLKRIVNLANQHAAINYRENKVKVELWLYDFFDRAVHEQQYDIAAGVMAELKRMENNGDNGT
jgi:hypothetical protein